MCALLTACTTTSPYVPTETPGNAFSASAVATTPAKLKGILFISDTDAGNVWLWRTDDLRLGVKQPFDKLQGISYPVQMAVDASGTLYVANAQTGITGAGAVTIYPRGKRTPSRTLSAGLNTATGVAVDSAGSVYVSDKYAGSIVKFLKGQTTPAMTFSENLVGPDGLAVDRADNLFIADSSANDVLELEHGTKIARSLHLKELSRPLGIAVDSKGNIYVSNLLGQHSRINVYSPGATRPIRSFLEYGPVLLGATVGQPMMLSVAPGDILLASAYLSLGYSNGSGWIGADGVLAAYAAGQSQAMWSLYPGVDLTTDDAVFQPEGQ